MNETITLAIALISVIIASYSLFLTSKTPKIIEERAESILNTLDETLQETLEPITLAVKKSYSHMGTKGSLVKQEMKLDKLIAEDLIDTQDPLIRMGLEMFPRVGEYIDKNPHLLPKLLPRLQALSNDPDFRIADLISPSSPSRTPSPSKHPFGLIEE